MLIVGLDAASKLKNFGFALGRYKEGKVKLLAAGTLNDGVSVLHDCISAHVGRVEPILVAIDAPLGWPTAFGRTLATHQAGERLAIDKAALFQRLTDQIVHQQIGKKPLEVAADKIARAGHTALIVLDEIRRATGRELPLLWQNDVRACGIIEVYPGAMLKARRLPDTGYKKPNQHTVRSKIAEPLKAIIPRIGRVVDKSDDVFDACLCLVAAVDFLAGKCLAPTVEQRAIAEKEGWIWVSSPS